MQSDNSGARDGGFFEAGLEDAVGWVDCETSSSSSKNTSSFFGAFPNGSFAP